jgi:hypothetical protein
MEETETMEIVAAAMTEMVAVADNRDSDSRNDVDSSGSNGRDDSGR